MPRRIAGGALIGTLIAGAFVAGRWTARVPSPAPRMPERRLSLPAENDPWPAAFSLTLDPDDELRPLTDVDAADQGDPPRAWFPDDPETRRSPRKLPTGVATGPIGHRSPIDLVFDELWPEATAEEREVWSDALEGLPVNAARELLEVRRRIESSPRR